MHPFKYTSRFSAQIFWQKSGFILYCLNMSCKVICRECINFLRLTFNINLFDISLNVSNDRHNSSYICLASVWTSEQSNWCRCRGKCYVELQSLLKLIFQLGKSVNKGVKPFRFNIIKHLHRSLQYVLRILLEFLDGAFTDFILLP